MARTNGNDNAVHTKIVLEATIRTMYAALEVETAVAIPKPGTFT